MTLQSSAKREFLEWAKTLKTENLSNTDIKLFNLFDRHFDSLELLGTSGGRRAKKIGELITNEAELISDSFPTWSESEKYEVNKINRLTEMKIGPFRGFETEETFLFDKQFTFLYGPNGSGKSSFCEGMEYALVGEIEEAEAKRIPIEAYIRNEQTLKSILPSITAEYVDGQSKKVSRHDPTYRFSFIEKNRIDSFARISATTSKNQSNRISALFGLDSYSAFVDGFTEDFDKRHITLVNTSKETLDQENQKLIAKKARNVQIEKLLQEVIDRAKTLSEELKPQTFTGLQALRIYCSGEDGTSGKIGELQNLKAKVIPADFDILLIERINSGCQKIGSLSESLDKNLVALGKHSALINFKDLFTAVKTISSQHENDASICPACRTPLLQTVENPYLLAQDELMKMDSLIQLQKKIKEISQEIAEALRELNSEFTRLKEVGKIIPFRATFSLFSEIKITDILQTDSWKPRLLNELKTINIEMKESTEIRENLIKKNDEYKKQRLAKTTIENELKKILQMKERADSAHAENKLLKKEKEDALAEIVKIEDSIKKIIASSEPLQKIVDRNLKFQASYVKLVGSMKRHKDALPALLAHGLSTKAIEFYNTINELDPEFEKLEELKIPTAPGEKIVVKFRHDVRTYDALQIMSEGHIKCLGLSLLLAKVVSNNLNFIIYDDIVNAIDDNHRDGVASLMIENVDLKSRQQIITCHGELFINKLNHKLGASSVSKLVKDYRFTPVDCIEERGIRVSIGESGHYLDQARIHLKKNELKNAAGRCRQAIESVADKLWKKLGKTLNLSISVKMRHPGARPDLSSVVTSLIKELKKIDFQTEENIHSNLDLLQEKYNWALLNKGTHEDSNIPEFERSDVAALVDLLTRIDAQSQALNLKSQAID